MSRRVNNTKALLTYRDGTSMAYFRYFSRIQFNRKWGIPYVTIGSHYEHVELDSRQVRTVIAKLQSWLEEMEKA